MISQLHDAGYGNAAVIGHFFSAPQVGNSGTFSLDTFGLYANTDAGPRIVRDDKPGTCPVEESEILIWLKE